MLIDAFRLLGFPLKRRNPPSLVITHDVDTEQGCKRASQLKAIEDDLDLKSTWFLVSDEYSIGRDVVRDLACSRIGSHDLKHDGRLLSLRHEELVPRLRKSKLKLESIFENKVECFRSPLLQFSRAIVSAVGRAGYTHDFSLPCWEPVHPSTMGGFGVECVQRFEIDGVVETPLTLFQDHQVLKILHMNTHEAIKFWIEQAKLVRSLAGDIVLSVHPDYSFGRSLSEYRRLLVSLLEITSESFQEI
jgi:hypothetical protein